MRSVIDRSMVGKISSCYKTSSEKKFYSNASVHMVS